MQALTIIIPYSRSTSTVALSCKNLQRWLSNNGFSIQTSRERISLQNVDFYLSLSLSVSEIAGLAAANGDLPLLKWACKQGCVWSTNHCACAARKGHLEALKWLWEREAHWDWSAISDAAEYGHLEVLKWIVSRESEIGSSIGSLFYPAAKGGQLEVLKWIKEYGEFWDSGAVHISATMWGHLDILKWLKETD